MSYTKLLNNVLFEIYYIILSGTFLCLRIFLKFKNFCSKFKMVEFGISWTQSKNPTPTQYHLTN